MARETTCTAATSALAKLLSRSLDQRGRAFFVEKPASGRRWVIADIHGCVSTFTRLLAKINFGLHDQLFLLGDMVDRGPYSTLVLEKVWHLLNSGHKVYPLRGNHEQLYLNYNRETPEKLSAFAGRQYAHHVLARSGNLPGDLDTFFSTLPIYYETDRNWLVHAGFNTHYKEPLQAWKDMLWVRSFKYDARSLKGKRVLHGHVPQDLQSIQRSIDQKSDICGLDNGCVRAQVAGFGHLVALDMDSARLVVQKNVDLQPAPGY